MNVNVGCLEDPIEVFISIHLFLLILLIKY